jgi:GDP-4-dehydro-6-deoxy-D-mannose reductase
MRATVTGADGFVGQWLLRRLLSDGVEITGMIRAPQPNLTTLDPALAQHIAWRQCELSDGAGMRELLATARPDAIFHLAAQSFVPASFADPWATLETNVMGTARLLEAVRTTAPAATVVIVGSSDIYGAVTQAQLPLREDAPIAPLSPYAASKAAAELITLQYARSGFCQAVATRSFNHTGPGQATSFAIASFAKQIADIKQGRQPPRLRVGALTPRRDICDVRDIVDAYVLLSRAGKTGFSYNVCSGRDHSMREVVNELLRIAQVEAEVYEDPSLVRTIEVPVLRGDPARIAADTGWRACTPLEQTLGDVLAHFVHVAA